MSQIETTKRRRGWILRTLSYHLRQDARDVNDEVLKGALDSIGHSVPLPTLHADLEYLAEKGYVDLSRPKGVAALVPLVARITAAGIDLHEGSIQDVGVICEVD